MNINYHLFLSIIGGFGCFLVGHLIRKRLKDHTIGAILSVIFLLLALPGLLMVGYYFHVVKAGIWFIEFRTINHIEVINALLGLILGFWFPSKNSRWIGVILLIVLLAIPYIKPIIRPLSIDGEKGWSGNVCLQSTGATCGPASLATIFKAYGIEKHESEIAKAAYSSNSGTEIWYLLRYAKSNGLKYSCSKKNNILEVKPPAIIGVYLGDIGHFITILESQRDSVIVGDPLDGRNAYAKTKFDQVYRMDGFVVEFEDEK
jgi:hypothetical protein